MQRFAVHRKVEHVDALGVGMQHTYTHTERENREVSLTFILFFVVAFVTDIQAKV